MTTEAANHIISERYQVEGVLGRGSFGTTYRAREIATGRAVAIKELDLQHLDDWKSLELFEREAATLARLDHPNIPDYIEFIPAQEQRSAFLVQALAPGSTLEVLLRARGRFDEDSVRDLAEQMLEILIYLDSRRPPVIHRDIKPANLLLDEQDQLYLVDFGSVVDLACSATQGETVVGSFGYMAPEVLRGAATTSSDLFSVGATLIHLLTGVPPQQLPTRRLAISFRGHAPGLSEEFADFLDRLIAPATEDRFASAAEALRTLRLGAPDAPVEPPPWAQPSPPPEEPEQTDPDPDIPWPKTGRTIRTIGLLRLAAVVTSVVVLYDLLVPTLSPLLESKLFAVTMMIAVGPLACLIALFFIAFWVVPAFAAKFVDRARARQTTGTITRHSEFNNKPTVIYEFEAEDQRWLLRERIFQTLALSKKDQQQFLVDHQPGAPITVNYLPGRPDHATIHPRGRALPRLIAETVVYGIASLPVLLFYYLWSLRLGSSFVSSSSGTGGTAINFANELTVEQPLMLATSTGLTYIALCVALLGITLIADYLLITKQLETRIPRFVQTTVGLLVFLIFLHLWGFTSPAQCLSEDHIMHRDNPERVEARTQP